MENERELVHTRQIICRAFRLKNGFLEIEATLGDEKGQQVAFRSRPPVQVGEFMHRMSLTLTIDNDYTIQDVRASTLVAPWAMCGGTDAAYRKLIGLRIGAGFSQQVRELLGGTRGCTHVTELVAQAANTYMQASWPDRIARQLAVASDPRQWPDKSTLTFVDHCHAWRQDGETLVQEYPELVPPKRQAPPGRTRPAATAIHDNISGGNAMGIDPLPLDPQVVRVLSGVTTATLTTVLLKKGLRNVWMRGARPLHANPARRVGRAFTLRFVPAREDLATPASWASPISTRAAIEAMPAGCIAVVDAMGVTDAGIFGDILCARMQKREVAALITDGVVRDVEGVMGTQLPVWCQGTAAPASVAGLTFVGWQEPIGCGGVAVFPNDIVVADADGAVLIPAALLDEVMAEAVEQERLEGWIMTQVAAGVPLPGLYPANAETKARYEAWARSQREDGQAS